MSSAAERAGLLTRKPARSIAWRIFLLVVASVLAATSVLFAVTFSGPPARVAPLTIEDAARALRTGVVPDDYGRMPPGPPRDGLHEDWLHEGGPPDPFGPRRPPPSTDLLIATGRAAPTPRADERADPHRAAAIAALLAVPVSHVVAYVSDQPAEFRLTMVGSVTLGWTNGRAWRVVRTPVPPFLSRWHLVTLSAMGGTLLLLSALGWRVARAIAQPLKRIAAAAREAQAGGALPALPERGPAEVRSLSEAVATMHARLARHAELRTGMLAAIAHDLGTPLSRLAFWIEQLPDAARDRAARDIAEMRAMIADTLGFARDEAGERDHTRVDLGSLLDALVEDMRVGEQAVALHPGPRTVVRGDPRSLRRLFANLVGNAIRYGDSAELSWSVEHGCAVVLVEDHGPGIDPAQAERLFEPFVRGEASRNRATGGTGLGLAIVRAIATRHGGQATLENRPNGGARARVMLPVAG